jgi:hypothetical protein
MKMRNGQLPGGAINGFLSRPHYGEPRRGTPDFRSTRQQWAGKSRRINGFPK